MFFHYVYLKGSKELLHLQWIESIQWALTFTGKSLDRGAVFYYFYGCACRLLL